MFWMVLLVNQQCQATQSVVEGALANVPGMWWNVASGRPNTLQSQNITQLYKTMIVVL
jgi:hypothetical protein